MCMWRNKDISDDNVCVKVTWNDDNSGFSIEMTNDINGNVKRILYYIW